MIIIPNALKLFTDGSFDPKSKLGVGCFLLRADEQSACGSLVKPSGMIKEKVFVNTTAARLELETILWSLEEVRKQFSQLLDGGDSVVVYTDSQTVVNLPTRRSKLEAQSFISKRQHKELANADLYKRFFLLSDALDLQVSWIRGHGPSQSATPLEEIFSRVDQAARSALRREVAARKAPPRDKLLGRMKALAVDGVDCRNCRGVCCTYVANSMAITPREAADIIEGLIATDWSTDEIRSACEQTIYKSGLNKPTSGDGRRDFMRRTYTCPFFAEKAHGCQVKADKKPLGCLAFNPRSPGQTEGGDCATKAELVMEAASSLERENDDLRQQHSISWQRLAIPVAVIAMLDLANMVDAAGKEA